MIFTHLLTDHLSKFKNKLHPLPGTQVAIEQEYEADKQRFEDYQRKKQDENDKKLKLKLFVKQQSVGVQTKVLFDTLLNQPILEAEKVLAEKEALLKHYNNPVYDDDMKEIMKFWKNCQHGKYHYIGYAVSNGYRSIDYQDPETGDYALHLAVRQGNVNLIEELLKFKANPDVKNRKGNYPIHEAWSFWNIDPGKRTKEERLQQEDTTCRVLLSLLSYNAFIDALDYHKQTALHIASRIGTVRAVKILLTFRADMTLITKYNETAIDLAKEFQQEESYRLLSAWNHIKHHFIHSDFNIVWHQFLSNYESEIKQTKSAELILSELDLERNAKMMSQLSKERHGKESAVTIDDPLLQAACYLARKDDNAKIPKPWEAGWKKYVKQVKNAAATELKKKMENLEAQLKASQKKVQGGGEVGEVDGHEMIEKEEGVTVTGRDGVHRMLRKRLFPDLPTPLSWEDRENLKRESVEIANAIAIRKADQYKGFDFEELSDDEFEEGGTSNSGKTTVNASSLYNDVFKPGIKQNRRTTEELYYLGDPKESNLSRRRKSLAQKVCTDAKFLKFTRRQVNDSALLLALRSPQAPMKNTEEDGNVLRMIVSQGIEYERVEQNRQKDKLEEMFGIVKMPKKNSIGAYSEELEINKFGARDRLMDSLASNTKSAADILHKNDDRNGIHKNLKIDLDKKSKVDMVNDRRPRYVDPYLLPVIKEVSQVDKLIREQQQKDHAVMLKKQGLSSEKDREQAMLEMQNAINVKAHSGSEYDDEEERKKDFADSMTINRSGSNQRQRSANEREQSMKRLFLGKPVVHYGSGRLTSTHNMKGKLEEPWTTVGGRYQTLPGDRTT